MKPHGLTAVTRCCVADGVMTMRDILPFKYAYLKDCAFHSDLWRRADEADRAKEERRQSRTEVAQ